MAKKRIDDTVKELVQPITEKYNFELVDVEFVKEGANWYLRVYIDKPGGITLDDCQVISEEISSKMDTVDPIEQSYFLEVSSPGLDRPLKNEKDFEKFKGELVELKLYQPVEGKKIIEGELVGLRDNKIIIKQQPVGEIEFDREKVVTVRRVIKF